MNSNTFYPQNFHFQAIECGLVRQRANLFEKKIEQNRIMKEEIKLGTTLRRNAANKDAAALDNSITNKDNKNKVNIVLQQNIKPLLSVATSSKNRHQHTDYYGSKEGLLIAAQQEQRPASLYLPQKKSTTPIEVDKQKLQKQNLSDDKNLDVGKASLAGTSASSNELIISPSSSEEIGRGLKTKHNSELFSHNVKRFVLIKSAV